MTCVVIPSNLLILWLMQRVPLWGSSQRLAVCTCRVARSRTVMRQIVQAVPPVVVCWAVLSLERLQLGQTCNFCSKDHSLKIQFCRVILCQRVMLRHGFFLLWVSTPTFSLKGLAGAWLLLGPLCTLSTPSGETSCSSSLRIFRL